ncbi:MAG: TetR/AcrR family transcriptional regulator [Streptosporangiaceae bacterium]
MKEAVRERNRRGQGTRLRAEILAGATQLLEDSGSEEAVTLRAIARQIGISAPSIYSHFPDREAIVDAIVDDAFSDFNAEISGSTEAARSAGASPAQCLRAGCAAYLRFAAERPNRYRLLFERRDLIGDDALPVPPIRTESFELLVASLQDCIDAGVSVSDDPVRDGTAIWVGLHGYATLHGLLPGFPWPADDVILDRIVFGMGQVGSA